MFKGWSVDILPLEVIHHRPTSTEINKGLRNSLIAGTEYYREGYDILLGTLRSVKFGVSNKPKLLTGFVFFIGYLTGAVLRKEKHVDKELANFARTFQYKRIKKKLLNIISGY